MVVAKKKKSQLEKEVVERTTASMKRGRDGTEILKNGVPLEHSTKHSPAVPQSKVIGLNKGSTINMGDYQSFRVDCWLSDVIGEDETPEEAFQRLSDIIDKRLQMEVDAVQAE